MNTIAWKRAVGSNPTLSSNKGVHMEELKERIALLEEQVAELQEVLVYAGLAQYEDTDKAEPTKYN